MRQIFLDTETTGLSHRNGDRVIEIGCVEIVNRQLTNNNFQVYLDPERSVSAEATAVHGLTNEFLSGKPKFSTIAQQFIEYVTGAEIIIHNAAFDIGFINSELAKIDKPELESIVAKITCSLKMARAMRPGQKNSLDILCRNYNIDNSHREYHGALLDAELTARVYLAMTSGQVNMNFSVERSLNENSARDNMVERVLNIGSLPIIYADQTELAAHREKVGG